MFHFRLEMPSAEYADSGSVEELESVDDYQYLVIEGCGQLDETDCRFHIGGFGREDWGFDLGYDTSSLVEELPELLAGLGAGKTVSVDLYSQGVERTLTFAPRDDQVDITCVSRTSWIPDPETETLGRGELMEMLHGLAVDFSRALDLVVPEIGRLEPFASWKTGNIT